jgi:hypothetical protein
MAYTEPVAADANPAAKPERCHKCLDVQDREHFFEELASLAAR